MDQPMSQGTRCHQLALFVVFESPLQMLCDSPSNYLSEPEMMEFLEAVPTVWHETRVLDAKVGEYVVIARRNGKRWYVAAMTDWTPRNFEVDVSFLGAGEFTLRSWSDGVNADRFGNDFRVESRTVRTGEKISIHMKPGGGWAGAFEGNFAR